MEARITGRQLESTIALFIIGSSLVTGTQSEAGQDTWICLIIAMLLNIPLIWIQSKIIELYPGRNYIENIIKACGKPIGKTFCVLLLLYSFHIAALVMKTFCVFIRNMNMPETPLIFVLIALTAAQLYVSKKRINVVARISKFILPVLLVTVFITLAMAYKCMNISNIKPILKTDISPMIKSILLLFTLPLGESVICAPLFSVLEEKAKVFPVFLKGTLMGFAILLIANLRNLFILGPAQKIYIYASYQAVSVISIGDFFTRIEVIIGFNLLLAGFIKFCVALFTCSHEVEKIFGLDDYVPLLAPCSLILITLVMVVSTNIEEVISWLQYHALYSIPFQVFIPCTILLIGKIKNRITGLTTPG
ncbi:MAG: endospore germination permease [Clostridiaceae bacterium]|nr:endospore germination permease [Clostridiaceae bacterium]